MTEARVWHDIAATLRPRRDDPHGPLPPLLLALTLVTGLVDATSYLKLCHVFVANMTGNVVFLGFGIAGAGGISVWASLTALGSFLVGGVAGGRIGSHWPNNGVRQLTDATTTTELLLVAGGLVIAAFSPHHIGTGSRYAVIVLLAVAMGVQNATHREEARRPRSHHDGADYDLDGRRGGFDARRRTRLKARSSRTFRRSDAVRRVGRRGARLEGRQPCTPCTCDRVVGGRLLRHLPRIPIDARVDTRRLNWAPR